MELISFDYASRKHIQMRLALSITEGGENLMSCKPCTSMGYSGTKTCPSCRGTGKKALGYHCDNCGGSGQVCLQCGGRNY